MMEAFAIPLLVGLLLAVIGFAVFVSLRNPQEFWMETRRKFRRHKPERE